MKIALITPGFSASDDDWCIPVLLNLVRELAKQHEVHVFTLRYPHEARRYTVASATVHALGGATVGGLRRIPLLNKALKTIREAGPFDVVQGFWADEAGAVAAHYGRRTNTPAIVSLMGGELVDLPDIEYGGWRSFFGRNLTKYALKHATAVTVGSQFLGRMAQPYVDGAKIITLPLGVDETTFKPQPRPQNERKRLLHVGSLIGVKDHKTLLQAFAQVRQTIPNCELLLVGDGVLRGELEGVSAELSLTEAVQFMGNVAHDQLSSLYGSADLLVMSSRHESQCLVLLEALACGCPAVGTDVGLFAELLPPQNVVPVRDPAALAQAIIQTLSQTLPHATPHNPYTISQTVKTLEPLYRALNMASPQ